MYEHHRREILGISFLVLGLLIFGSVVSFSPRDLPFLSYPPAMTVHNWLSHVGVYLGFLLRFSLGWASLILPILIVYWGLVRLLKLDERWDFYVSPSALAVAFFVVFSSLVLSLASMRMGDVVSFGMGGLIGYSFAKFLLTYFGLFGAWVIGLGLLALSFVMVTHISIVRVAGFFLRPLIAFARLLKRVRGIFKKEKPSPVKETTRKGRRTSRQSPGRRAILRESQKGLFEEEDEAKIEALEEEVEEEDEEEFEEEAEEAEEVVEEEEVEEEFEVLSSEGKKISPPEGKKEYVLPPIDILDVPIRNKVEKEDIEKKARIIEQSLAEFNIPVKVINVESGPVITRYELEPAPGVKIQKIVNLADDLALNLRASSVRIVAPIPGKGAVGIEVPNTHREAVFIRDIVASAEFAEMDSPLTLGLGKDTAGHPVVADLRDMPHLLIAGATGSGKTVCVNAIIVSMLMKASPKDLRFILVDPKMVEMTQYNRLPHLLCPVITDVKAVSSALNWLIGEMERRYQVLAKEGVRNIRFYNQRHKDDPLPYIVLIIDELADIMAVAQSEVETGIARLAQLSRAVGIHLILATQRPSVDVITGVIKANFPARISFKVASRVDSRTVLDSIGAEKLLGKGDMLFMKPGSVKPQRIQGAYVQDKEIERIVDYICAQAEQEFDESVVKTGHRGPGHIEKDELFDSAVDIVLSTGQASVSILQRRMRLGYARAARLIDMMEEEGIVGPYRGSRPREILIDREEWLRRRRLEQDAQQN